MPRPNQTRIANWLVSALALGTLGVCVPRIAQAHFHLDAPPSWANQNSTGDPQKSGPCGETGLNGAMEAVATNIVTPFQPGETITVTLTETITHPGHYRVALATDRSMLPADPPVTAGATACGSTVIDSTPDFPVLVDGALVHTSALSGKQTIQVTLPTNVSCSKCTLQVIEFMSNHGLNNPGGCFYHHCADISIGAGGASGGSGGGGGATAGKGGASGKGGNGGTGGGGSTNGGATGQGGAPATGGVLGAGGTTMTGGANGTGGTSSGGSASATGGTTNTGGTLTTTGGSTNTGGVNTGGSLASTGGSAGAGGAPADDGGCGFVLPGRSQTSLAGFGALLALGALWVRRRR